MTAFVVLALLGAVARATVELEDVGPSLLDGKAALAAGMPEQELIAESGLDTKAWGHELQHIWPDSECPNIGMRGPEIDGTHLDLDECKEMCLTIKGCNAVNYNHDKVCCVMRSCKAMEHPTNHNSWSNEGWVGFRLKMSKAELESELEALAVTAAPAKTTTKAPPDTEAGVFAEAEASKALLEEEKEEKAPKDSAEAKKDAEEEAEDEKEEEIFTEEEDPDFESKEAKAAKEEDGKGDSVKKQEEEFEKEDDIAEKIAAKKAAAAIEAAAKKEAAEKKAAAEAAAAKEAAAKKKAEKEAAAEAAAAKAEAAAKKASAKKAAAKKEAEAKAAEKAAAAKEAAAKKAEEKEEEEAKAALAVEAKIAANLAAAAAALEKKEEARKAAEEKANKAEAAKPVPPPPFSYTKVGNFGNCNAKTAQTVTQKKSFRNGVRFSIAPALPEGIELDSKTGAISGTYKKHVKKGHKGVVKHLTFVVTATISGLKTTHDFKMSLDEHHCPPPPSYLWMALAAIAVLVLLCLLCFLSRKKSEDPNAYEPLKKKVAPADDTSAARIKSITANEHPTPAPRPAHITSAQPTPVPPTAAASVSLASFAKEATQTWSLKGVEQAKGQSSKFADPEALAGQVGCTSTWKLTPGVPLTFHTPSGEVVTVFAVQKPLKLSYDASQPIKINDKKDGHGTDLGIDLGWTFAGIGYQDITQMPFAEANKLLHDRVNELPGGIPLTFKRTNGAVLTTYAYQKPLGLTFNKRLPIKITAEEDGHHAQQIGIKVGWELLAINYINISRMTDFDEVKEILVREVSVLPSE